MGRFGNGITGRSIRRTYGGFGRTGAGAQKGRSERAAEIHQPDGRGNRNPPQSDAGTHAINDRAGTYASLNNDYHTVGLYNFAIGRADLPDDLVYQLVKTVFENQASLIKAHSSARETIPQNIDKDTFLPFHPGAIRYYREIGIKIPDALVPKN